MKEVLEAILERLLEMQAIGANINGLCEIAGSLSKNDRYNPPPILTMEQHWNFIHYLRNTNKDFETYFNCQGAPSDSNDQFHWRRGEYEPRIKWLNDNINKFK